ncbi:hypothetical protein AKJ08_2931 [Vulgatibacter incomptus]|uniref:Uncharacterized protein n=1 Tax=Vulgatibacter incomptus TaxID=1391653 RepID=A0A0K1PHE9_9BACT|nr:hypothetical protein AKJ08_2931 [Vulgatibacter incomptus]
MEEEARPVERCQDAVFMGGLGFLGRSLHEPTGRQKDDLESALKLPGTTLNRPREAPP